MWIYWKGSPEAFVKDRIRSVTLHMCKAYPFVLYRPMEVYLRALESYQRLISCHTLIDVPDYVLWSFRLRTAAQSSALGM